MLTELSHIGRPALTPAQRQAIRRARVRHDREIYRVELPATRLAEALIEGGFVIERDSGDRPTIERALADILLRSLGLIGGR